MVSPRSRGEVSGRIVNLGTEVFYCTGGDKGDASISAFPLGIG